MTPFNARRSLAARTFLLAISVSIAMLVLCSTALGQADTFLNGDGHDGTPANFGAGTFVPNAVAPVSGAISVGATTLTAGTVRPGSGTGNVTFGANRLVLILQTTGYTGAPVSGSQAAVDITANGVAKWEFARMTAAAYVAPTLNFTAPLINSYAAGTAQIIAVPEFAAMTVNSAGANITAQAWDGTSGGVVSILTSGTISFTAAGVVHADAMGFRGGQTYVMNPTNIIGCASTLDGNTVGGAPSGLKGEGLYPSAYSPTTPVANVTQEGRGNYLNAGAGGNCFNASGGGGSNGGGGGKGGQTLAPYDGGRDLGGFGGAPLTYNPYSQLVLGGGGGSGERNNTNPGTGGRGGGVVMVRGGTLTGTGVFRANGSAGVDGSLVAANYDGSGGGGAGGTVLVRMVNGSTCGGVQANGGVGGNNRTTGGQNWSPGGGGGGGKTYVQGSSVACAANVTGGSNGTNTSTSNAYQATAGTAGTTTSNVTALAAPTITVAAPANGSYQTTTTPTVSGTSTNSATVRIYIDGALAGTVTASGAGAWTFTSAALGQGSHTVYAQSEIAGVSSANSATNTFTVDSISPVVAISAPTAGAFLNDTTPSATFTVTETNPGTTTCATDAGAFSACTSPYTTATLADGAHSISVRHTDSAGLVATTTVNFTIDATNPVLTISAPTAGQYITDNTPSATFTVTETNAGTTTCATDAGAFSVCSSPYTTTTLADGAHSISVRHSDLAGNVTTTVRNFTVDTVVPVVSISSPTNGAFLNDNTPSATFTVTETNPGTTTCATDAGAFSACTSPYTTATLADGARSISVRHTDLAGQVATSAVNFTIDTVAPAAPVITSPAGSLVTSDNTPTISGTAENNSAVSIYDGATLLGTVTASGAGAWTFTSGTLTDAVHSVTATATDAATNVSPVSAARAITVDTTNPVVTISTPTNGQFLSDNTPDVTFSVADATATTTQCSVDGGAYAACTSVLTTSTLADGARSVAVRATDAAGNQGTTTRNFTVDTVAPVIAISTPTAGQVVNDSTPSVTFAVTETNQGATTCAVDGGAYVACTSGFTSGALADGSHSFSVRHTDLAGNVGTTLRSFIVDATSPTVSITAPAPGADLSTDTPTITFTVTDANPGTTTCSVDGGSFVACSSPFTTPSLSDGLHTVQVRHTDQGGNVTTASISFNTDTTAPAAPNITTPAGNITTSDTTPTIVGTAEANSTVTVYEGATALGTATADGSGNWTFTPGTPLAIGPHTITATATDAAGNEGAASSPRVITIDTGNPVVTIGSPTAGQIVGTSTPGVTFSVVDDSPTTTECSVDGGSFASCASVFTTSSLSDGAHSVTVRATDDSANQGSATRNFVVDTTFPTVAITGPADGAVLSDPSPDVAFTITEANAGATACSIDGGAFAPCSSPFNTGVLTDGPHNVSVRHTDGGGNAATSVVNFTIDTVAPNPTVITVPSGDVTTNNTTPAISGTAEANSTVTIFAGVTAIGTAAADGSGNWTFTPGTPLAVGPHTITATATDAAMLESSPSAARVITIDSSLPVVSITAPAEGATTGDNTPSVTFTATDNSSVTTECSVDGGAFVACTSPFTTSPLTDGPHFVSVRATDAGGNQATSVRNFNVDTAAPNAPVITIPAANLSTSDTTPSIGGTAEASSTVTVYDGATSIGTTVADGSGNWSFTPGTPLVSGAHVITATSTDAQSNVSSPSNSRTITIDTADPTVSITVPSDGGFVDDSTPSITFAVLDAGSTTTTCSVDGGAATPCTSPFTTSLLGDGSHTVVVTATDAAGNSGTDTVTFTVDTVDPAVVISAPSNGAALNDITPSISFSVTDANGTTDECSVDGGAFAACASAFTTGVLTDGPHTVTVRGTDTAGNADTDTVNFTVDTAAPTTTLTDTPPADDPSNDPSFDFESNEPGSTFECSIDGGAFTACTSPHGYTDLPDGPHTFAVRSTDPAGNPDITPATFSWNIDTIDPAAPVIAAPASGTTTNDTTPTITGTAEANSTVIVYNGAVALGSAIADGSGNWSFTPSTALASGSHPLTATATDAAGNESAASNLVNLTIDVTAPNTSITSAPTSPSDDNTPTFVFAATESGSSFECSIDGAAFTACTSPLTYLALLNGPHIFTVRATDAVGNTDATPASHTWTVDTVAPDAPIVTSPVEGALINDSTPLITGTAEPNSTVENFINGNSVGTTTTNGSGAWNITASPALADGTHTVRAHATDAAGNTGPFSATVTFTVDTTPPDGTALQQPDSSGPGKQPVFDLNTPDGTATITCSLNGSTFVTCASPFAPPNLPVGTHVLVVRFTDPAGNTTVKTLTFVITGDASAIPIPAPAPICPIVEGEEPVVAANIAVVGGAISRKTLLKFTVTSDQFIIARVTVKNGTKKLGSQARALNKGKRQVVIKIKQLPKNTQLAVRLSAVSLSGGKSVAQTGLNVDKAGKVAIGPLNGQAGGTQGTSVVECGRETGAAKLKVKVTPKANIKVGAKNLVVTATSTQFAVSTFKIVQNGKVLSRKVYVLSPGKTLKAKMKLLGSSKMAKGNATLTVSTFSVDGVRVKVTKKLKVK